jgi:hypothetical protein
MKAEVGYPPFASAVSPFRISDIAGRKGWGTQSVVEIGELYRMYFSMFLTANEK